MRLFNSRHVSRDAITACAREMAILIEAGIPLVRAVRILHERTSDRTLAAILGDVADRIESGSTFAAALANHPRVFDELFVNLVKVGETGGSLELALQRLAAHYERERLLQRRIRNAMMYPIAAVIIAGFVIGIIVIGVVPSFASFYEDQGVELPWPTAMVKAFGDILIYGWWAILIVAVIVWVVFRQYKNSPSGRRQIDLLKLHFPYTKSLYRRVVTTRLSNTLSTLIQNGIQLVPALRLTGDTVGNVIVGDVCKEAATQVEAGESLSGTFEQSGLFPPLFMDMLGVGEEAGALDQTLDRVSVVYEDETRMALDTLVTLIQPLMVIVIGVIVILLALAVLMPYFGLQDVLVGS